METVVTHHQLLSIRLDVRFDVMTMYIQKYQVEEGELLIREQNARLQLQDAKLIVRNRRATTEYNARLIQKCYRKWRKKIGSHEIRRSAVVTADMVDGGAVSIGDILVEPAST